MRWRDRNNKYLAISVWTYDLAAPTNRLPQDYSGGGSQSGSIEALRPLCRLQGSTCPEGSDCFVFASNDNEEEEEKEEGVDSEEKDGDKSRTRTDNDDDEAATPQSQSIICTQMT